MLKAFYHVYRDGKKLKAIKIHQYEAKKEAIMNMDVNFMHKHFAAGMDNICRLYSYSIEDKKKKEGAESKVIVKEIGSQTTALGGDDDDAEYQKCIRFSLDGKLMAAASSEGQVKVMKVSKLLHFDIFKQNYRLIRNIISNSFMLWLHLFVICDHNCLKRMCYLVSH